jgi:rubredoxin
MKTYLLITVDCGKTTCGKCKYVFRDIGGDRTRDFCDVFTTLLNHSKRCPDCLDAETKARKGARL